MKVLIFGDIYGRLWRKAFWKELSKIRETHSPDFIIANIENITSWRGPVSEHAQYISDLWVDIMTWWDHIFDNSPNINEYLNKENSNLIRPANFYSFSEGSIPWNGYKIIEKSWKRLLVIQLLWEVFMNHKVHSPFITISSMLKDIPEDSYDALVLDFHRETTAELYGMAHYLDGKASLVYGTHTHIQTNDAHILLKWTWVIADVGMNGPFNSVIWADYNSVKKRFLSWVQRWKIEQQLQWPYIINALLVEIDDTNKSCTSIQNISYTWEL